MILKLFHRFINQIHFFYSLLPQQFIKLWKFKNNYQMYEIFHFENNKNNI